MTRQDQFLGEILRRPFSPTQLRALITLLHLTHGHDRRDVVATVAALAAACHAPRGHFSLVLDGLVNDLVIGRDLDAGTWWLHAVDLWAVLPDPRLDAAQVGIVAGDDQRRGQGDMWPPPSAAEVEEASEIQTGGASEFQTLALPAYARAPGQATRQPGLLRGKGTGLDARGFHLLSDVITWCSADGGTCTGSQREHWGWRVWTQPLVIEAALQAARKHVAQGKATRSRFGLVKSIWRRLGGDDTLPPPPPRSAGWLHGGEAPAPPAGGVHTSGSVGPGESAAQPPTPGTLRALVREAIRTQNVCPDVMAPPPLG